MSNTSRGAGPDISGSDEAASNPTDTPSYYKKEIGDNLSPDMRALLLTYSGIPEDQLFSHLHAARDKAWIASPYPCIGLWSFLRPRIRSLSSYGEVLERAKSASPGTYIVCDVGTGMGQELRCLVADGVPSAKLRAIDLNDSLWKCSFDLFQDKEKMSDAVFSAGDILEVNRGSLKSLIGTMDVMIAGLFLHCFSLDSQFVAASNLAALARSHKGSLIIGWQLGGQAVHIQSPRSKGKLFLHNDASFNALWKRVCEKRKETWTVNTKSVPLPSLYLEEQRWLPRDTTLIEFVVRRE